MMTSEMDISRNQASVDYLIGDSSLTPSIQLQSIAKPQQRPTNAKNTISARISIES